MTTDTSIRSYKYSWHKKWVDETKWNNQLASVTKLNEKVVGLQQWQALLQQVIYLYSITHFNTLLEFVCDWWAFKDFVDKITFLHASTVIWWEIQDYDDFVLTYGHHWINEQNFFTNNLIWGFSYIYNCFFAQYILTFWCHFQYLQWEYPYFISNFSI